MVLSSSNFDDMSINEIRIKMLAKNEDPNLGLHWLLRHPSPYILDKFDRQLEIHCK